MSDQPLPARVVEQTNKNLALAERFLAEVLEDESILDGIEKDSRLVLIPRDDQLLARANFELALRETLEGRKVALRLVGGLSSESHIWHAADVRDLLMHEINLPTPDLRAEEVRIVWDQARDTLLVDFATASRPDFRWLQIDPHVLLRVETETFNIVGYLIESFFTFEARRSPALLRAFRGAEIRAISDEELGEEQIAIVHRGESSLTDEEAAEVATAFLTVLDRRSETATSARLRESA
jgi:hypothetical protein